MWNKTFKYNNKGEGKEPHKPVSIYVNFGHQELKKAPTDISAVSLYVNYRHGVARSYYLIPPTAREVHVMIDSEYPGPKMVEFLDSNLHTLHNAETTVSGTLVINAGEFLNGCCYLRLANDRLLCLRFDKWPDFLPPFLRKQSSRI